VTQGERQLAKDNKSLGTFNLDGIPSAPKGVPQIEVTFDIDANGILSVSAKDKGTGKEQKITIKASGGLSETEIEQMVKDAEVNKEEDEKIKEKIEARNNADGLVASVKKTVEEHGDKVSEEEKTKIETAITDLEEALKGDDVEDIKTKTNTLTESSMKLGEAVYKDVQKEQQEQKEQPKKEENKSDDNVVDADFEDVPPVDKQD
jgi:molecular chaperone DnaK